MPHFLRFSFPSYNKLASDAPDLGADIISRLRVLLWGKMRGRENGYRGPHRGGLGGTADPMWFRLQSELHGAIERPLIRLKPKPLCWRSCMAQGFVVVVLLVVVE